MTIASTAHVPTESAGRYLQQLCKHWSHNLNVEFSPEAGTVVFPRNARGANWSGDGKLTLAAHPGNLECTIEASSADHLDALKGVVASHLDRFAFREAPLKFEWSVHQS